MKRKDSLARKGMKLLCTILGLVLVVMLGGTFAFRHLLEQINYTPPQPSVDRGIQSVLSAFTLSNSSQQIGGPGSDLMNILLIGQDAREGEDQARSDSMILCSYNKNTKQLTMTSFLRDLYVQIPGHGGNRINAAYAFGGTELLKQTISQNFDVYIDGTVEVDFSHFEQIIDHMGGVTIELRQDEAQVINEQTGSELTEGMQTLDGFQALTYSRIRKLDMDGDFSRTSRQRKVITALVDSIRNADITDLTTLLGKVLPMLTTDLTKRQLLFCVLEIVPNLSQLELQSQRIPADGTYSDKTIDGMEILAADMDAQKQYLRKTLLG